MFVPVEYLLSRGQQVKVFSVIARKARELGFLCPDLKKQASASGVAADGKKYEGATVLDARRGAYFDIVSGLDFASLVSFFCTPFLYTHMPKPGAALVAPWRFKFLGSLLVYNVVVFAVFLVVYLVIDFDTHFGSEKKATFADKLYFCMMTHSNAMAGDFVPRTAVARRVLSLHILFTWLQLLFVFYTPGGSGSGGGGTGKFVTRAASKANIIVTRVNRVAAASAG